MDTTQAIVIVIVAVAICGVVVYLAKQNRGGKVKAKGYGIEVETGPVPASPGAVIEGASSTSGGATAEDWTGDGAIIKDTNVSGDLTAINHNPERPDPKA